MSAQPVADPWGGAPQAPAPTGAVTVASARPATPEELAQPPDTQPMPAAPGPVADPWAGQAAAAPPQIPLKNDQGLGFVTGIEKPLNNAAVWASHGLDSVADSLLNVPAIRGANDFVAGLTGLPNSSQTQGAFTNSTNAAIANQQADVARAAEHGRKPGMAGQIAGGIVGSIPAFAVTRNPWIGGAAAGALDTNDPNSIGATAQSAGIGAVGGKLGDMAAKGVGAVVAPRLSAAVQALRSEGVQLTPGQLLGGGWHRVEDGMSHLPIVGDLIKGAQNNSVSTFNRAAIDRTLAPIGQALPHNLQAGNEAVEYATNKLSDAYNTILPRLTVHADQPFASGLSSLSKNASMLPKDQAGQFANIVDQWIKRPFQQGGLSMSGETMKTADGEIGRLAASYSGSNNAGERELGRSLFALQGQLRDLVVRSNPGEAKALNAINQGWAQLVRVHGAAGSIGAGGRGGVFTASNLLGAVKSADKSVRKNAFAQGNAMMQDLAQAGQEVLPSHVNDSGTAGRGLITGLLLGGGHALHTLVHPLTGIPLAGLSAAYTKAGQRVLNAAITSRPGWAPAARGLLSHFETPAGVLGAQAAQPVAQGLLPSPAP